MRQSELFTKTRKDAPKDEVSRNAILLTRAGFVHKEMAGVYSYLPLGLLTLKKIENIIREEMNAIGGKEIVLTALQRKDVWEKVGRWDDEVVDVWFKTKLKDGTELGLGFTHDEELVNLVTEYVQSYKDLPLLIYQIQTKFRNELRAKSGIMRGREFLMKDLYSFTRTPEEQEEIYEKIKQAYINVFNRCGIGDKTYFTVASGGTFSQYSHEFQTVSDAGEDSIYLTDEGKQEAINAELGEGSGEEVKAIEVGNLFKQGTKFTDPFGLKFRDEDGEEQSVLMGGYGIGVTRLMGTVAEVLSDEKGLVWPESVSPFQIHLLSLTENTKQIAGEVYKTLQEEGVEVLYDDRDLRAGEKFNDADLIGISKQLIIGDRALESGLYELKDRQSGKVEELTLEGVIKKFANKN